MAPLSRQVRKSPRAPAGCDGYLTRRQAARALGFASEFKIRRFERDGILCPVRGPMQTAFYPRAEILALKARLVADEPEASPDTLWTDAELLALLGHPKPDGQPRTALDLVLETQISIERAERVYLFGTEGIGPLAARLGATDPPQESTTDEAARLDESERRSAGRLSRDALIRELRNPDPRVRELAFTRLQAIRTEGGAR